MGIKILMKKKKKILALNLNSNGDNSTVNNILNNDNCTSNNSLKYKITSVNENLDIKFGSDAAYDGLDSITFKLNNMSERLSRDQEHIKNIIDYQEQKQK